MPDARQPSTLHISQQPVMVMGLNGTELMLMLGAGFGAMVAAAVVAGLLLGQAHIALLIGSFVGLGTAVGLKMLIAETKRQKPDGYCQQLLYRWQRDLTGEGELISHDGVWDHLRHGP